MFGGRRVASALVQGCFPETRLIPIMFCPSYRLKTLTKMVVQYIIRQANPCDLEILNKIHTENMKGYVEFHYYWNPELFKQNYSSQEYQVIELDSQIIGFIKVIASKTDIYLGEIQIAKKFQNLGIGTNIINSIIEEAKVNKQRLWLKVIKGNPAEKLYRRLGFTTFVVDSTHKKLEIKS